MVSSIAEALTEVRRHFSPENGEAQTRIAYLVLGTERGFCGAYNEQLLNVLAQQPEPQRERPRQEQFPQRRALQQRPVPGQPVSPVRQQKPLPQGEYAPAHPRDLQPLPDR